MITEKEKSIAKEYLVDKEIEGIWVNSAGELFFDEGLAKASDKEAEFVKKSAGKKKTETADQEVELKAKNLQLLQETNLEKENYKPMLALANFFDIKTEDKRAETLIKALTEFKETLKTV
jgi:hypothetical protein